jgi:hypothetical protein
MTNLTKNDGRWFLDGSNVHCGDSLEVALEDGSWLPVRFELAWAKRHHTEAEEAHRPVLHVATRGFPSPFMVACDGMQFRWPRRSRQEETLREARPYERKVTSDAAVELDAPRAGSRVSSARLSASPAGCARSWAATPPAPTSPSCGSGPTKRSS